MKTLLLWMIRQLALLSPILALSHPLNSIPLFPPIPSAWSALPLRIPFLLIVMILFPTGPLAVALGTMTFLVDTCLLLTCPTMI